MSKKYEFKLFPIFMQSDIVFLILNNSFILLYHSFFIKKDTLTNENFFKLMETGARGILGVHAPRHVAKE